jgi:hypothetical protein
LRHAPGTNLKGRRGGIGFAAVGRHKTRTQGQGLLEIGNSGVVEKVPASEKTRDRQGFAVAKRTQSRCFSSLLLICGTWKHREKNKKTSFSTTP